MVVTWEDFRSGGSQPSDIYAQRVPAGGIPAWTGNGVAVCAVPGDQCYPQIASVRRRQWSSSGTMIARFE